MYFLPSRHNRIHNDCKVSHTHTKKRNLFPHEVKTITSKLPLIVQTMLHLGSSPHAYSCVQALHYPNAVPLLSFQYYRASQKYSNYKYLTSRIITVPSSSNSFSSFSHCSSKIMTEY